MSGIGHTVTEDAVRAEFERAVAPVRADRELSVMSKGRKPRMGPVWYPEVRPGWLRFALGRED